MRGGAGAGEPGFALRREGRRARHDRGPSASQSVVSPNDSRTGRISFASPTAASIPVAGSKHSWAVRNASSRDPSLTRSRHVAHSSSGSPWRSLVISSWATPPGVSRGLGTVSYTHLRAHETVL